MSESFVDSADLQAAAQVVGGPQGGDPSPNIKRDRTLDDDDDEDDRKSGRERRKIEIRFIQDKSRRHITFSKRKAGIMKKAYELSVLTGTQVLLLVVSETGLVYTFTTPKLQPLVTKPEGKNLIQACLNAPEDTPQQQQQQQQPQQSQQQPQVPQNGHPDAQQQIPDTMGMPHGQPSLAEQHHLASQQDQVRQSGMGGNVYISPEQAAAYNHYLAMPHQQPQQRYMAPQHPHQTHQ